MKIGTKSLLYGIHCFWLHPWFVLWGWYRLYGFPWDPRIWVACLVHDWGYWGKEDMDGKDGKTHPSLGAKIMHRLFDKTNDWTWHDFTFFHSRTMAERCLKKPSKLCYADKYAICATPAWLYIFLCSLTGELEEYMHNNQLGRYYEAKKFKKDLDTWVLNWIEENQ